MGIMPIVKFPNQVLATKTKLVEVIDSNTKKIIDDMLETMYQAPGVGLAANQVGLSCRIAVIDVEYSDNKNKNPIIMINPKITSKEGETFEDEGCLSLPGVSEKVKRFKKITVSFMDLNGDSKTLVGEDLLARAIQHECDHLDGKLYIDRLSSLKREFVKKRYLKTNKETNE